MKPAVRDLFKWQRVRGMLFIMDLQIKNNSEMEEENKQ